MACVGFHFCVGWFELKVFVVEFYQSGFEFLTQPAGFDIGESLVPYDALDQNWKAFLVGVLAAIAVVYNFRQTRGATYVDQTKEMAR